MTRTWPSRAEPCRLMARIRQVSRPRSCCAATIMMAQKPPGRHGSFAARVRPNPRGPSTGPGPRPNRPGKGGDSDAVRVPRWWAPARRRNDGRRAGCHRPRLHCEDDTCPPMPACLGPVRWLGGGFCNRILWPSFSDFQF